jgi:hypothetical protein
MQSPSRSASQFDASAAVVQSAPQVVPELAVATIDRLPATTDSEPVADEAPPENRTASFEPEAVGMEMGYDVEGSTGQTIAEQPARAERQPPRVARMPTESLTDPEIEADASPTAAARVGTWTRGVGGKLKGLVPWSRKTSEADPTAADTAKAEAPAETRSTDRGAYFNNLSRSKSRAGNASVAPTTPSQDDSSTADAAPVASPWYQRLWR